MQIAELPGSPTATPTLHGIGNADRARLSGPGLRTFRSIADFWGLSEAERIASLGYPARSTFHAWMKKAVEHQPMSLPFDTLIRISAILGIHKALSVLFHDRAQALKWLTSPHRGTVFAGASPLKLIVAGGQDGMMSVRRYLDSWRGGQMGQGAAEGSFEPVTEADIVFL